MRFQIFSFQVLASLFSKYVPFPLPLSEFLRQVLNHTQQPCPHRLWCHSFFLKSFLCYLLTTGFCLLFGFQVRISPCILGCPGLTGWPRIDSNPPASASPVLGLEPCTIAPGLTTLYIFELLTFVSLWGHPHFPLMSIHLYPKIYE